MCIVKLLNKCFRQGFLHVTPPQVPITPLYSNLKPMYLRRRMSLSEGPSPRMWFCISIFHSLCQPEGDVPPKPTRTRRLHKTTVAVSKVYFCVPSDRTLVVFVFLFVLVCLLLFVFNKDFDRTKERHCQGLVMPTELLMLTLTPW